MKVLWLCNIEIPTISSYLGNKIEIYGGWLSEVSEQIMLDEHNSLLVLYPAKNENHGENNNMSFYSFSGAFPVSFFEQVLEKYHPDIIHVWGTEFPHTCAMCCAARNRGLIEKLVISIQGLVSIYAKHFFTCIPNHVIHNKTIHEVIKGHSLWQQYQDFKKRGSYEIDALKICKNVIGRTDFDFAATSLINPSLHYYHCNETLRHHFYQDKWDINFIKRYSIFVSQCSYSVKGFHVLLSAIALLKEKYPQIHVYTTGPDIVYKSRDILRRSSYEKYIASFISKNRLETSISFLGYLDSISMKREYLKANVVVSPSLIENSSNSIGEAMLLGCPVVSSDVGGIKTLLTHEKEGLLYQVDADYMLAYCIDRVFSDDDFAVFLGNNAQERAKHTHDSVINYNQLTSIYHEISVKARG